MSEGPYDLALKLSCVDGISPVLLLLGKQFGELQKHFEKLTTAQKGLATAFAGVAGGALGVVAAFKECGPAGDKLLDQQDKLQRAGVSLNETLRLQASYYKDIAKQVPTSTAAGYLKTFNEMRSVVGAEEAEKIAPWSMKLEAIIANATGKSAEGEGFKMWRAMEMTGRSISDPMGTQKLADALSRDIIGSGGKLDAGTYQTMAKRGGAAWANATPAFLAGPMSVVGADLGGETAGTAMMSAYMFMTGANTLSKQQYAALNKAGLIDPTKVTTDKGGRVNVGPGGIIGSKEFAGAGKFDLFGWEKKYLNPGLDHLSGGDRDEVNNYLSKLGRNRNVIRMLQMFNDPGFLAQIDKDITQWKQAKGVDQAYSDFTTKNPLGVKAAFWDQLESLKQAIGAPMEQNIIPFLHNLTGVISDLGAAANAHPRMAADLAAMGGGALGGAAMGGAFGMLGGPAGMLAGAGIGAMVGALSGLAIMDWPAITGGLTRIHDGLRNLFMGSDADRAQSWCNLKDKLKGLFAGINDALANFADSAYSNGKQWGLAILNGILRGIDQIIPSVEAAIKNLFTGAGAHAIPSTPGIYGPNDKVPPGTPVLPEKHSSLVPPAAQVPVNFTANINLDGRKVASVVTGHMVASATYPTSAAGADSRGTWMGPSWSPTEQG